MRLSFLVGSPILYLAVFKTILAALFRAFGLPRSFLPSKPSLLHDHSSILLIVFKIFKGLAPSYLRFLITPKPVSKYNLRSSSDSTLLSYPNVKPKATLGERAFLFAAPKLWNAVPRFIRESISVDTFKRNLKTHLFKKAFCTIYIITLYF